MPMGSNSSSIAYSLALIVPPDAQMSVIQSFPLSWPYSFCESGSRSFLFTRESLVGTSTPLMLFFQLHFPSFSSIRRADLAVLFPPAQGATVETRGLVEYVDAVQWYCLISSSLEWCSPPRRIFPLGRTHDAWDGIFLRVSLRIEVESTILPLYSFFPFFSSEHLASARPLIFLKLFRESAYEDFSRRIFFLLILIHASFSPRACSFSIFRLSVDTPGLVAKPRCTPFSVATGLPSLPPPDICHTS